jgi:hypothetical protein
MLKMGLSAAVLAAMVTYGQANAQDTATAKGEELRSWSAKINDARRRFEVLKASMAWPSLITKPSLSGSNLRT